MLQISKDLSLPLDAVTETFAFLAKRGKGKTYAGKVLFEEMVKASLPVVAVDPIGVWWGLRANADGTGPGLPVVIFGGSHADVPLLETAGALIADVIVEQRFPAVLDFSHLSKSAARRFMTDFAERLYHINREPLHVILDEADAWAPQRVQPGGQRLLGAIEDLVRRGRARGLGLSLITQRPAVLNKDVLTQCEILVAMGMTGVRDVDAIDEWVRLHADDAEASALKDSLPILERGDCWVWSPSWLGILKRVQIRLAETFDSSRTPKPGERSVVPRELAPVDLEKLNAMFAATIEETKNNDPVALRKRVVSLEKQVERLQTKNDADKKEPADSELVQEILALRPEIIGMRNALDLMLRKINLLDPGAAPPRPPAAPCEPPKPARAVVKVALQLGPPLPGGQQRILDALFKFERIGLKMVQRANLAVASDQSPKSSAYDANLRALRVAGYIEWPRPQYFSLTPKGRERAQPTSAVNSLHELHSRWVARFSGFQSTLLRLLIDEYPDALTKHELSNMSGQSINSSSFETNLRELRDWGLIVANRSEGYRATTLLFPEGLKP